MFDIGIHVSQKQITDYEKHNINITGVVTVMNIC